MTQVNGFTGSPIWHLLYSFPPNEFEEVERGYAEFAERFDPIMDVFDAEGVRFAQARGVDRVTLARELSLEEIRKIREQTDCEQTHNEKTHSKETHNDETHKDGVERSRNMFSLTSNRHRQLMKSEERS